MAPVLAIFDVLDLASICSCLDLGAGTGALGIALAILQPHLRLDLLDRSRRAAGLMELLAHRLNLDNIVVICADAHEFAHQHSQSYHLVCSRAFGPAQIVLPLAAALTGEDGYVAAWHQSADDAYLTPPSNVTKIASVPTHLMHLSLSVFRVLTPPLNQPAPASHQLNRTGR